MLVSRVSMMQIGRVNVQSPRVAVPKPELWLAMATCLATRHECLSLPNEHGGEEQRCRRHSKRGGGPKVVTGPR